MPLTMAKTSEQLEELLKQMREKDLPTLLAFDRRLHLLLEQKRGGWLRTGQGPSVREEFCRRYPHVAVDPDLFALVGVHPESPIEEDKALIRESISRRLTE